MTRATFMAAIALLYSAAIATPPPVTVVSPCEYLDAHGKGRWAVKNERVLVVNRKLRVANDVDEQNMSDFELDLFLDLNGHLVGRLFPRSSRAMILPLLLSTQQ